MPDNRQDPYVLLSKIQKQESDKGIGRLKIFFGYAAGAGKTYAMLKAACNLKNQGVDVVAGYIEHHGRPQTAALQNGLEQLERLAIDDNGIIINEFDIDAALARKPQLLLVDDLAHTNADVCRHAKRYQDVAELLKAGIDVYTTVNVQHIESLNDTVTSITGILERKRIPDSVFDHADQVELVDIEPQELIDRLHAGAIYSETQAKKAIAHFFTIDNLTALREVALRRCADRANLLTKGTRLKNNGDYHINEHILVCLSSSPSNAKIIRTASRMAGAFRGSFTALFVETHHFSSMDQEDKKRLRSNIQLAQQLGARMETVYGDDIPLQIAEFARLSGVSKIVIGRSAATRKHLFSKPTLTEKLIMMAPNLDVHIIPDTITGTSKYLMSKSKLRSQIVFSASDLLKSMAILIAASCISSIFDYLGFTEVNIITIYILGVLITSVITTHRIYSLMSAFVSVLVFNLMFIEPRYTLLAYDRGYPITFLVMFTAAFITGSLATRLKDSAKQSARAAFRTKVLFDTNQLLQQEKEKEAIVAVTANQLTKLLDRAVVIYTAEQDELGAPQIFTGSDADFDYSCISDDERAVAAWVFKNNKHAGATTNTLSNAKCLYLAIRTTAHVYGVIGIVVGKYPMDTFENSIVLSILGESALAMENEKNTKEKEEAAVLAKNEQLRANLLRAISHDLRTPLTSISGNASNLLSNDDSFDTNTKVKIYTDIYDDSMWLINLVENLLSVTRLEGGQMNLHMSAELLEDVITEALRHINRKSIEHKISVDEQCEFLLAKMDAKLIVQVVINIVDNAIKYTPKGSSITITLLRQGAYAVVKIADDGSGIPDEIKSHVFEMFYSGANKIVDSRRSLGLGLSLCKSIIAAHGGKITVEDNDPQGTVFTFTLPIEEAHLYE